MSSSIGRIIPCIVENKACSKPSISCNIIYNYEGNHNSSTIINRSNTGNKENNDNTSDNDKKNKPVTTPLKNMSSSMGRMTSHILSHQQIEYSKNTGQQIE